MRIAELPDRIGQADDVVWEARGDEAFLSSHLILSADPATEFLSRTIANCLYRRGRMVEEWVVRDSLAIALQLGLDPDAVARDKVFRGYIGSFVEPAQPDVIAAGDSGPRPDAFRPEVDMVLEFIERVWNDRDLEKLRDFMVRDLTLHTVGYRTFIRPEGYRRSLLSLVALVSQRPLRGTRHRHQFRRPLRGTADRGVVEVQRPLQRFSGVRPNQQCRGRRARDIAVPHPVRTHRPRNPAVR